MATSFDEHHPIVISEDAARGGVVGHNVRYVLAYSMTGLIAVFAAIALYLGFDQIQERAAAALAQSPWEMAQGLAPYAGILLAGAIALGLLLGLWNHLAGRTQNASQSFMRFRVAAQFVAICVIMAILTVSAA